MSFFIDGIHLPVTYFPDNTSQVWKLPEYILYSEQTLDIYWEYSTEADVMVLAQLKTLLDSYNITSRLYIEYLPYGRQDKPVDNSSTFALTVFAKILNSLSFEKVFIHDPHSVTALRLINQSEEYYPVEAVSKVFTKTGADLVCYPDQGAFSKYKYVYGRLASINAFKNRDPLTGNIIDSGFFKEDSKLIPNKKILIVDDICDGGATFIKLAELLHEKGAEEVNLFVTHGLFTKGLRVLKNAGISRIFTPKGEVTKIKYNIHYKSLESL